MPQMIKNHKWATFFMVSLVILAVLVAGCGAGSTAGTATTTSNSGAPITAPSNANQQKSASPGATQQYLITDLGGSK
jgi:uncharacterized protein YceK